MISAVQLAPNESDELLFVFSFAMTVTLVATGAMEAVALGAVGSVWGGNALSRAALRRLIWLGASKSLTVLPMVYLLLAALFAVYPDSRALMLRALESHWPILFAPLCALPSSAASAYLISRGKISTVLVASSLRTVPLLIALLLEGDVFIQVVAVLLGEASRSLCLIAASRVCATPSGSAIDFPERITQLAVRSIFIQTTWVMTSQLSVALLRAVFAAGAPGTFTAGETALRIQNVASQVTTSGFVMPRVARIPALFAVLRGRDASHEASRQMLASFVTGTVVSVGIGVLAFFAAEVSGQHTEVRYGAVLGLLLVISCGPIAASTWASRAVVYSGSNVLLLIIGAAVCLVLALVLGATTFFGYATPELAIGSYVAVMCMGAVAYAIVAKKKLFKGIDNDAN